MTQNMTQDMTQNMKKDKTWIVAALYRFMALEDLPKLQKEIKTLCDDNNICGTLLIAPEGINGTIAGQGSSIETIINFLDQKTGIKSASLKYSSALFFWIPNQVWDAIQITTKMTLGALGGFKNNLSRLLRF